MANHDLYVKRATITALKAAAGVTTLVPAERVYPLQRPDQPMWPFIGYGVPISQPFRAACLNGSESTFAVHNYAETTDAGGGEDYAMQVNAAIEAALDGAALELDVPGGATAHYTCEGSQVIQDGSEADKFHGFVTFRVTVSRS